MKKFNFKNYLFNFLVVLFIASLFTTPTPMVAVGSMAVAFATGTAMSYIQIAGLFMAVQKEIWQNHIEQEIFKDNAFLKHCHRAEANLINATVVHIPQSGGSGNVVKNRAALPAAIRKRVDTDIVYVLDEYTTDPVTIPDADKHELTYDKMSSVIGEDTAKLNESIAEETLYSWTHSTAIPNYAATSLPVANILETSGEVIPATAPSATGNRLGFAGQDLQNVRVDIQKRQKKWKSGQMYGLLTPDAEAQLFPANNIVTTTAMNAVTEKERREGVMYFYQGFHLMTRESVLRVNAANVILTPEAAGSATDDEACLFWNKNSVEFVMGNVKFFENLDEPTMFGDVYSSLARTGARARRIGYEGIVVLKQAKSA